MPSTLRLPLFPLGLVLYPGERLPLHIFEPRYQDMTRYCLEEKAPFGIVLFEEGAMADVGCTARIKRVINRYEDGRLDILTTGERRFEMRQMYEDKAYLTAEVGLLEEPEEPVDQEMRERVITQHMKLLELAGHTVRPSLYEGVRRLSYVLAQNAGLQNRQKQRVLEMPTENKRIAYLAEHLESLLPRVEEQEDLRRRIRSNGHFKDFPAEDR